MKSAFACAALVFALFAATVFSGCVQWFDGNKESEGNGEEADNKEYTYTRSDFFLAMSDGVNIDCLMLTPDGEIPAGGWPAVILIHGLGGNKETEMANDSTANSLKAPLIVQHGYLTFLYSVRGQGESEGYGRLADPRQIDDISEIITWLSNNPIVDKNNIACIGGSQGGCSTWMIATKDHRLKTVVPMAAAADFYQVTHPQGCVHVTDDPTGVLKLSMYTAFVSAMQFVGCSMDEEQTAALAQEITAGLTDTGLESVKEYYKIRSPYSYIDQVTCPVFMMGGWYDYILPADHTIWLYQNINTIKRMYLGGGFHFDDASPEESAFKNKLILDWLDYWLKGVDNGVLEEPKVVYSTPPYWPGVPSGEYRHGYAETWPPENTNNVKFYMHADGTLSTNAPEEGEGTKIFVNSYATEGLTEDSLTGLVPLPNNIQPSLTSWLDTASYVSEPLESELELTGTPFLSINISSTGAEYNLAPKIWEICEDGSRIFVTRGAYRVSDAALGEVESVSFSPYPFSHIFAKGSRIEITISNVDFPLMMPCYTPCASMIYHDAANPSSIILPIIGE